jgi:hypothetical protein
LRHPYTVRHHGGDRMTSELSDNPEYCDVHNVGLHSHYLMPGHGLLIHRSILSDRLYWPGPDVSHMYSPRLLSPCLFGEGVRAGVRLHMPLCPVHVVVSPVGLPDCISMVLAQGLHRQIEAAACAGVTFYGSLRAVLFGRQDHGPPFIERVLFSFELLLLLFQAPRSGD